MKRSGLLTRVTLLVALSAIIGVLLLELRTRDIEEDSIRVFRQENLLWNAMQVSFETQRFIDSMIIYEQAPGVLAAERALARFDVLWSRLALFESGYVGERLRSVAGAEFAARMADILKFHVETIEALAQSDEDDRSAIIDELRGLLPAVQSYVSHVADHEERRMGAVQRSILEANRMGFWRGVGAIVTAFALMVAAAGQASADRRRLQEQRILTAEAREASEAKSRFLTMMSHELRTPMNGVIGTLALLERTTLDDRQIAMTSIAQRSAVEMLGLIEDILDLNDIQSGGQRHHPRVTTQETLAEAIRDSVGRRLLGRTETIAVTSAGDGATPLLLDVCGVVRIVRQAAFFFMDRLAAAEIAIVVQRRRDEMILTVAAPPGPRATWEPEAFFGPLTDPAAAIQTEAIGPAVARGLLAQLRGTGLIMRDPDGRTVLTMTVPVRLMATEAPAAPGVRHAV